MGLYSRDRDYERLCLDCIEYYHRFKKCFGSSKCRDITGVRFKEGYDIRRFFLKGIRCLRVVCASIGSVFDIIQMPYCKPSLKHTHRVSPPFSIGKFHCAGAALSRIESRLNFDLGFVSKITRGFSGGIAFQGDICGALMGGVSALGILYGTELQRPQPIRYLRAGLVAMKEGSRVFQNEHLHPSFKTSLHVGRLYGKFVSRFGSADCAGVLGNANGSTRRGFCEEVVRDTAELTLDLIKESDLRQNDV